MYRQRIDRQQGIDRLIVQELIPWSIGNVQVGVQGLIRQGCREQPISLLCQGSNIPQAIDRTIPYRVRGHLPQGHYLQAHNIYNSLVLPIVSDTYNPKQLRKKDHINIKTPLGVRNPLFQVIGQWEIGNAPKVTGGRGWVGYPKSLILS